MLHLNKASQLHLIPCWLQIFPLFAPGLFYYPCSIFNFSPMGANQHESVLFFSKPVAQPRALMGLETFYCNRNSTLIFILNVAVEAV